MQSPLVDESVTEQYGCGNAAFHCLCEGDNPIGTHSFSFRERDELIEIVACVQMIRDVIPVSSCPGLEDANFRDDPFQVCRDPLGVSYASLIPVSHDVDAPDAMQSLRILGTPLGFPGASTLK